MNGLVQDLRYALRQLRKSPGFTFVAVITLALGIGANTTIFSLIDSIMLRTLPLQEPERLVQLNWSSPGEPDFHGSYNFSGCLGDRGTSLETGCTFSYPVFERMKTQHDVFSRIFGFAPVGLTVNFSGRTSAVQALLISGDFFTTLGAHPALGRFLAPSDDADNAPSSVVVSYRFWRTVLGGDANAIGQPIRINKTSAIIMGVAPPEFPDLDPGNTTDLWVPLAMQPRVAPYFPERTTASAWLEMIARLKPGVGIAQAETAASTVFAAETTSGPEAVFKPGIVPRINLPVAARGLATLQQRFGRPLSVLWSAVALVLLLACANLAGLMLARATARRSEVAMRTALGASRLRLVRQLLTESVSLCVAGGGAGIILGYWGAKALVTFLSSNWFRPFDLDVHPDWRVLGFTLAASALVAVLSGLAPAFVGSRIDLVSALKDIEGKSARASLRPWLAPGKLLVISQIALAMVVLAGAGLFVRTLSKLKTTNTGFDPQNVVVFGVDTTFSTRTAENLNNLGLDLQDQLAAVPGVTSVTYSSFSLISGASIENTLESIGSAKSLQENVYWFRVGPDFFRTMRIPLLDGRMLNTQDVRNQKSWFTCAVAVVNGTFARRYFGKQSPVGQHFRLEGEKSETEIVGVVGDAKYDHLRRDIRPVVYVPINYDSEGNFAGEFEVRTALDPKAMMPRIRAAVSRFDSDLLITNMETQTDQIDHDIYQERLIASLSGFFALLALTVACIGIYGLLSYQVTRRTHEIGIRLALGAERADVLRLVLRQAVILAIAGVLIGSAAALAATRYLESFLFEVRPSDPVTLVAVAALLIGTTLMATFIPARRAMKVDPMVALRYE